MSIVSILKYPWTMNGILIQIAILIGTGLAILYAYFRKQFSYWKIRNVPQDTPKFLVGSLKGVSRKNIGVVMKELYEKSKNERYYGIWLFHKPALLINDLELIKDVLVKEFMSFHDHSAYHDEKVDPVSANLFAIEGAKWRNIRAKMTPTFTSGKMKMMFPIMKACSDELRHVMAKMVEEDEVVEIKELIARFSTDIIASCAFGIEANSLKNPNATFRVMGRKLFEQSWSILVRNFTAFVIPEVARLIKMRPTPKEIADFFVGVMRDTINYRQENNIKRNDFLQLLIQLMNQGYVDDVDAQEKTETIKHKFTFEEVVPEAFIFFVGGFETSSTAMQFILYELAMNPDIQDKLRKEIRDGLAESNGEMTYENVHNMEYMGRVIQETLRKYPPATFLTRVCTKQFKIPESDLVIEKDTVIVIPTYGAHFDDRYFPDSEKFDPDRFLEDAKASRNHYAYLPFGEGPRICIGQRFAMMQMRTALITVLNNFKVSIAEGKTPIPIEFDYKSVILTSKGGMHLKMTPI